VPPGIHALDLLYTFYPFTLTIYGKELDIPIPIHHAKALQSYFVSFVKYGDPNVERGPETIAWDRFGEKKNIVDTTLHGFRRALDNEVSDLRCGFWQRAPYT